jgi:hypothetical protein
MAVRLSALRTGRCFTPQKHYFYAFGIHFCQRMSKPQGLVRPEGLGNLIKIIHLNGSQIRDLPVCKKSALTTTICSSVIKGIIHYEFLPQKLSLDLHISFSISLQSRRLRTEHLRHTSILLLLLVL